MTDKQIAVREETGLVAQGQGALQLAQQIFQSGLAPRGLKTPQQVAIVILTGRELGWGPMQSLSDLYVVSGKVGMMTGAMAERLLDAGHRYEILEHTPERCSVRIIRKDGGEFTETLTFAECHEMGWDQEKDDKDQRRTKFTWRGRGQKTMLLYRTVSAGIREFCPEVLRGMRTVDELADANGEPDPRDEEIGRLRLEVEALRAKLTPQGQAVEGAYMEAVSDIESGPETEGEPDEEPEDAGPLEVNAETLRGYVQGLVKDAATHKSKEGNVYGTTLLNNKWVAALTSVLNRSLALSTDVQDNARHLVYQYLFGKSSAKELTLAEGTAMFEWLVEKGRTQPPTLRPEAQIEARMVFEAAERESLAEQGAKQEALAL